jgi:hypothetical protein
VEEGGGTDGKRVATARWASKVPSSVLI